MFTISVGKWFLSMLLWHKLCCCFLSNRIICWLSHRWCCTQRSVWSCYSSVSLGRNSFCIIFRRKESSPICWKTSLHVLLTSTPDELLHAVTDNLRIYNDLLLNTAVNINTYTLKLSLVQPLSVFQHLLDASSFHWGHSDESSTLCGLKSPQ